MANRWLSVFKKASKNESVEYFIDGLDYYAELCAQINYLNPGDTIYIMGWMFNSNFNMFVLKSPLDLLKTAKNNNVIIKIIIWDNPLYHTINTNSKANLAAVGINDVIIEGSDFITPSPPKKKPIQYSQMDILIKARILVMGIQSIINLLAKILPTVSILQKLSSTQLSTKSAHGFLDIIGKKVNDFFINVDYFSKKGTKGTNKSNPFSVCAYHDKVTVIIKKNEVIAYCGGIDYNPNRNNGTMHDLQCKVKGPAAEQILDKFIAKWNENQSTKITKPTINHSNLNLTNFSYALAVGNENYKSSLPDFHRTFKKSVFEIIKNAKEYIYIEDQYMVNFEVATALNLKINKNKNFLIILLIQSDELTTSDLFIPAKKREEFINELEKGLTQAEKDKIITKLTINPAKSKLYPTGIHSKLIIADDEIAVIGSSNINQRSFTHDSETSLIVFDDNNPNDKFAKKLRIDLWRKYSNGSSDFNDTMINSLDLFTNEIKKYVSSPSSNPTMLELYTPDRNKDLDVMASNSNLTNALNIISAGTAHGLLKTLTLTYILDLFDAISDPCGDP